jgi:hypothetical protein
MDIMRKCLSINTFLFGGCSSLGQGLLTSTFIGEIMVAIVVATLGLVLFALLIGNMQVSVVNLFLLAQEKSFLTLDEIWSENMFISVMHLSPFKPVL